MAVAPARSLTTRAATLAGPGVVETAQVARPEPRDGETLVRVEGCGVCASSLPVWEGRPWFGYPLPPGAPGHEAWGVEVATGRRVTLHSYHGFGEHEVVRDECVVPLPAELDGVPFPGEALGCAMNVFRRSAVAAGERIAVVGAGFLGLLLVQLCVGAGASVVACSRRSSALDLARLFGAETPDEPADESFDVVIEAGGVQATLDLASRLVRTGGRLVIAGFHQDGPRTVDLQSWNWRGLDVSNAHERDGAVVREGMRAAVQALVDGRLRPEPLYTHVLPLERLGEAFELARLRPEGFVKALVVV